MECVGDLTDELFFLIVDGDSVICRNSMVCSQNVGHYYDDKIKFGPAGNLEDTWRRKVKNQERISGSLTVRQKYALVLLIL